MGSSFEVKSTEDTCCLYYLSEICNLDFHELIILYEKFGRELFFIFYILSGKKITFPTDEKLVELQKNASDISKKLAGVNIKLKTEKAKKIFSILAPRYSNGSLLFNIEDSIEITCESETDNEELEDC